MPPRLDLFSSFRAQCGSLSQRAAAAKSRPTSNIGSNCQFSSSSSAQASTVKQKRKFQDHYALVQIRARKAANISRQETLQVERSKALGDPVRGITTPFVESFDTCTPVPAHAMRPGAAEQDQANAGATTKQDRDRLNYFVSREELESSIEASKELSSPVRLAAHESTDPVREEAAIAIHQEQHANAAEALRRIVSLDNTSSKDRTRINIQRCIDTFGRHNTDGFLRPKPRSNVPRGPGAVPELENTPRAGQDTGSSEVQIAILTSKIRALAGYLDRHGKKDKANKRNLRLLVHRRQKLLAYLHRREKGGERWQFLIQTLGLTEGTWKGEISM